MNNAYLLVSIIILVALVFDYTNGFHDAANAIATSVANKALKPRQASRKLLVVELLKFKKITLACM